MRAAITVSLLLSLFACDSLPAASFPESCRVLKYLVTYPSLEEMAEKSGRPIEQVQKDYEKQTEKAGKLFLNIGTGLRTTETPFPFRYLPAKSRHVF